MQRKTALQIVAAGGVCLAIPFIVTFPSVDVFLALGLILVPVGIYGFLKGTSSPAEQSPPEAKPSGKFKANWKVVLGVLFVLGIIGKAVNPDADDRSAPLQQYAKKDGTFDERKNDLDELCQDRVFYRAKSAKYSNEGDVVGAGEAFAALVDVDRWLSEYNEADVEKVCKQYEKPEKIAQYMR
ncbi:MAG: hypothetical protein V7772_06200 [Pseudomonas profundi]|uniref:hypothetical protein n=1 Tax=Pseudomonas profundi TaxID=1981513 RepID=UPI00300395C3